MTEYALDGKFAEYIEIITNRQLLDTELWEKCVNVFSSGIDNADAGWRGEFWGKMMRGACLIYSVNRSERLYSVLTNAVEGLLKKQTEDGRISTYRADNEFYGWDMWSRKYVMTGLQHYCDICSDGELKARVMTALRAHADYIIRNIGKGKKNILDTGEFWGGVNSASILEPFVRLYRDTKCEKYLEFAAYIVESGGCRDGNLIDCALEGKAPFEFPEQKAYETMSFFEGVLAFYEVTKEEKYLKAVCNFAQRLLETDVTVIGSCGCTHELFDNSYQRQTEYIDNIMQETCVTVTLMRFLSRLYGVTHDKRLTDAIRISALNALAGALNINGYEQCSREINSYLPGMVFDSYSPLCDSRRGMAIGGFKRFADGTHFGCCACIASAGFAVYPLMSISECDNGFAVNYIVNGRYKFVSADGKEIIFTVSEKKITLSMPGGSEQLLIKISCGDESTSVSAYSDGKKTQINGGYTALEGEWKDGDEIVLDVKRQLTEKRLNGKSSLCFGGYVLAADTAKSGYIPGMKVDFIRDENGSVIYKIKEPQADEQLRIAVMTVDGELVLTDYASAGQDGKSIVSAWFITDEKGETK
ncbi:MAG: glycoside hydrolase family 127 protein [Clostridia bacterium]|nr:glycoside hydrolase family 127 protein [Clostridia bacterium]